MELKREWTVREVEEVVEARMALWKRVRSSSSGLGDERQRRQAAAKTKERDKLGKGLREIFF